MQPLLRPLRSPDAAYLGLLGLLTVLFFLPFWSLQQTLYRGDIHESVMPLLHWLHGRYRSGLPVAWIQGLMGGVPLSDSAASFELYPPSRLILTLFPAVEAMLLILWSHTWWAACGCYALARQQKAGPGAAFFAAVLGAFGGAMVFSQRWFTVGVSLSWVPWTLLGLLLLQEAGTWQRRASAAGLLALALGLGFNGGYPGITVYLLGVLALVHGAWLLARPGWLQFGRVWGGLALAAAISISMSAAPALTTRRLAPQSMRGQALNAADASFGAMSPASLGQVVLPDALGRSWDNSYLGIAWRFGTHEPQGLVLYTGLLGLALALIGLARAPRSHAVWALAWLLLALYALGDRSPVFLLLSRLPVLDHLRHVAMAGLLGIFVLVLPAAWGVEHLEQGPRKAWVLGLAALGLALLAASLALVLLHGRILVKGEAYIHAKVLAQPIHRFGAEYYLDKLLRWLTVLRGHLFAQGLWALAGAAGLALVLWRGWPKGLVLGLLLFGELASNGMHTLARTDREFYDRVPSSVAMVQAREAGLGQPYRSLVWGWSDHLRATFPNGRPEGDMAGERAFLEMPQRDMPLFYGLDLYNAYFPTVLKRHHPINGWAQDGFSEADMTVQTRELFRRRRLWDLGGAKYVFSGVPLQAPGLVLLRQGAPLVYENRQALPLAYFAEQASGGWDQARAEAALFNAATPQAKAARPALVEAAAVLGQAPGSVRWRSYDDALWDLEVEAGKGGGTLVLSRTYYEGLWQATVDGQPVPLWAANVSYCALAVPQGAHRVKVQLKDPLGVWGPWSFGLGLLLALGLLAQGFLPLKPKEIHHG